MGIIGMLSISHVSLALPPSPSAGFWTYVQEFGDNSGQLFDPVDLKEMEQLMRKMQERNVDNKNNSVKNKQPTEEAKP